MLEAIISTGLRRNTRIRRQTSLIDRWKLVATRNSRESSIQVDTILRCYQLSYSGIAGCPTNFSMAALPSSSKTFRYFLTYAARSPVTKSTFEQAWASLLMRTDQAWSVWSQEGAGLLNLRIESGNYRRCWPAL